MATPIGHALAGYAVYKFASLKDEGRKNRRVLLGLALSMAIAPDLDFVPGIAIGQPALYHQLVSHSIGIGLAVSVVTAGLLSYASKSFITIFNLCFVSYLSHLAIDFFAPDGRPPYGQPLLWPISDEYFLSPVSLFLGVHHAGSAEASTLEWLAGIFTLHNVQAIAMEVIAIGPLALVAKVYHRVFEGHRE